MAKKKTTQNMQEGVADTPENKEPEIIEGQAIPMIETPDSQKDFVEESPESSFVESHAQALQSAKSAPFQENTTSKKGGSSWLMWALMWVLLAAVAWTAWDSKTRNDNLEDSLAKTSKNVDAQNTAKIQELSDRMAKNFGSRDSRLSALEDHQKEWELQIQAAVSAEIDAKVKEAEKTLHAAQASLKAETERLQQLQAGAPLIGIFQRVMAAQQAVAINPEWASTLLRSALDRLKMQTDAQSANLLPLVEDDLAQLSRDAHFSSVTTMLKTLDEIAKTSTYWGLKRKAQEKQLEIEIQRANENPSTTEFSWNSAAAWLKNAIASFWSALSDFVRVQSATPEDMMAETAPAWMLYENMRQRLMTLKLSLAALNEPVFLAEVDDTLKAIERDFDTTDSSVIAAQKYLKEMQNARFGRPTTLKSATFLMAVPYEVLP